MTWAAQAVNLWAVLDRPEEEMGLPFAQAGSGALAASFQGNIDVRGAIFTNTKDFKIDHPLDPANKYLYHASVESSEMMNIYTGNVTTDVQRDAAVRLPDWFETLNTDFRYQLTVVGQFAKRSSPTRSRDHRFSIRTDKPNVEVSWQVTGVRRDAFAKAHPLLVEDEKSEREPVTICIPNSMALCAEVGTGRGNLFPRFKGHEQNTTNTAKVQC